METGENAFMVEENADRDTSTFEEILSSHQRMVFRTSYRILGNIADAQDVTQDVFLRRYCYLHRLDRQRDIAPWL